ncbi:MULTISPECIES: thermonuclease family protein [unclassified Microcoleus]|uniref:thermonuclease family protein n=1 Tax=unclassified Microcoleus TaxID=2642155 RepID=UPI002FD14EC3
MEIIKGKVYKAEVGFIYDGDSFNLKLISPTGTESQSIVCRSQWIDTPESQKPGKTSSDPLILKHWEWAEKAKLALTNMLQNRALIAIPYELDQYQRWVCDVYLDNLLLSSNVQVKLAQSGLAVSRLPFNRHIYNVRESALLRSIIGAAATANRKKIGLWGQSNMILPYEFKKLAL